MVQVRVHDVVLELSWAEWEARVRAGRIPSDALVRFDAVTEGAFVRAADLEMYRSLLDTEGIEWRAGFLAGAPPVMTALLVGIQIRIWWWARLPEIHAEVVRRLPQWSPVILEDGESWRLLTMGMTHTQTIHLLANTVWMAYVGWNLERALGRLNLATLFFASVLGGSLLSMFLAPQSTSLGSSGGVFGLIGASVVFGFVRGDLLQGRGKQLFGVAILPYMVLMLGSGLMSERTDNWAHFGGLAVGAALVLLLDPEPIQRRAGWNQRVRLRVLISSVVTLLVVAFLGPRIIPTADVDSVRATLRTAQRAPSPPLDPDRSLRFDVPAGWRPGVDLARDRGFVSPVAGGSLRAWSVQEGEGAHLISPEQLAADWITALLRASPDAEVGEVVATTLVGREGTQVRAVVDGRALHWRGTTRGAHTLQEVWQVDDARSAHLAPLARRLRRSVVWDEPAALRKARSAHRHLPSGLTSRSDLAAALVRAGEVDEGFALHEALIAEAPADVRRWLDALESVVVAGPALSDADRWLDRALAGTRAAEVRVAVARALMEQGRDSEGRGLLELAWRAAPGDRRLKRARRRADLPTQLDVAGRPWEAVNDPVTGQARVEPVGPAEVSLAAAVRQGALADAERARVVEALVAALRAQDAAAALPLLAFLREGRSDQITTDIRSALATDLRRTTEGGAPAWLPSEAADALRAWPEVVALISPEIP